MKRSVDRVLTTHAGSLPRPDELREAWSRAAKHHKEEAELQTLLQKSVVDIVAEQKKLGIDIPNDGEFGKPMRSKSDLAAWGTYIFGRPSGFGPTPIGTEAPDKAFDIQAAVFLAILPDRRMSVDASAWHLRAENAPN